MVALNVVSRLRHTNDLRANRRKLSNDMHHDLLLRLLPTLLDLPLPIIGSDGAPRHLDDTLTQAGYILLSGGIGSGRTLALQQIARTLLQAENKSTPALIYLPRIDDARTNPIHLLSEAMQQQARGSSRKHAPQPLVERIAGWVLLISGLEELPTERQNQWRALLQAAPQQWPQTQVIITGTRDEARWPGFTTLAIATPSADLIERWIELLAPIERRAMLATALRSDALAPLGQRLLEVALLVIVSSQGALPATRAALYESALGTLYNLDVQHPDGRLIIDGLALLAAYDERPRTIIADLIEVTAAGTLRFSPPLMRRYFAARQLVAEQHYDLLGALDMSERREIARFCAGMMANTRPLFTALWGQGKPDVEELLTLGLCLRERPDSPAGWTLRIIGALALLARDGKPTQRSQAIMLVRQNQPALDTTFALIRQAEPAHQQIIPQLLQLLPIDLTIAYAERLVFDPSLPTALAWAIADVLVNCPTAGIPQRAAPVEPVARVRWAYVQVLHSPEQRATLATLIDATTIDTFASSGLDEARLLRVAAILVEDTHLPIAFRTAGLELLAQSSQPTALTVIERACYDADAMVRQTALAQLASRDAERGQAALSRAAIDQEAPEQTRIGAIEQLVTTFGEAAQPLLIRTARDATLPLYAQLLSVAALGEPTANVLTEILHDDASPLTVRALAASQLGQSANQAHIVLAVIRDQATPIEVIEGACAGLSAPNAEISAQLVRSLARISDDPDLTIAMIVALGRLGDNVSVDYLGELVGTGAWSRIEAAVPAGLHELRAEAALEHAEFPPTLALNLRTALACAATEAEQPTTVREFMLAEAERIRHAAAAALALIGGHSADAALLAALLDGAVAGTGASLVAALAHTGQNSAAALGHLVSSAEYNPMTRWLAVQQLRDHSAGEAPMHQAFSQSATDSFVRGALAEALGQRGSITALPLLRQIADDATSDQYLRSQAIIGLGLLDEPATEVVLIRLLSDPTEDEMLRGLAAAHLPTTLSSEGRRLVRDMLRRERQPEALTTSALLTLGRIRDGEALPLLLRFAQDERATVARAALAALDDLGDGSVAPVLVRVAQNPSTDRATRLRAIGTLLTIGGDGYRPLMRSYIEDGALPLRLQAVEHLIRANTPIADLLTLLTARSLPQPLRLRVLTACATQPELKPVLIQIASDAEEPLELRVRAVGTLQHHADQTALEQIAALAAAAPDPLRLACIETLGALGGSFACVTLGNLAVGSSQSPVIQRAARRALRAAVVRNVATLLGGTTAPMPPRR